MTRRYARIDSREFKVFDVDARRFTRAILTGDPERDNRNVSLLLATINAVNSMVGPRDAMRRFVDMLVQLTDAERGLLLLLEDGRLRVDVSRDREGADLPADELYSRSIPQKVLDTGESICFVDTLGEVKRRVGDSVNDLALRAVMCAPLRIRDQIFGVVYVDSRYSRGKFRAEDLSFFEAMCQQVAVTLENIRLSQSMVDAERMATIGQMTSMILHDLNSPMTVVDNYARMIASGDYPPQKVIEMAQEIQGSSDRIVEMLRSLKDFARGAESYHRLPTDLSALVRRTVDGLMPELSRRGIRAELTLEPTGDLPVDAHRLERALTNLLVNAMEAMEHGGALIVATRALEAGAVELSVTDSGPGIPAELRDRLFEPFVTHGKAQGTGLGLAIVKQIVRNHGGSVSVADAEGGGTTFRIRLPAP